MNSIKLLFFGLTEIFIKEKRMSDRIRKTHHGKLNSGTVNTDYLSEDR